MKKYLKNIMIVMVLTIMAMPFVASADTIGDLQSQIQSLMSQIKALQEKIVVLRQASTTPEIKIEGNSQFGQMMALKCPQLNRDLKIGSRGDDVKEIQIMLAKDPSIYSGSSTGYFGPQTAKAMAKFQIQYGIASTSTGFVGPMTRDFFGKRCAQPIMPMMQSELMSGTVTSNNGTTLSFNTKDGIVKSVSITTNTVFYKWVATGTPPTIATSTDATVGSQIVVEGKKVSDGNITALSVRIGFPMMMKMEIKESDSRDFPDMMRGSTTLKIRNGEDGPDYRPMMNW